MFLKDTINMMTSEEYKERFKAEYLQLVIRYNKLRDLIYKWDVGGEKALGFKPTCPRSTYTLQIRAMADYLAVLEARAIMEGIDLEDCRVYYEEV